jgi:excisionase family DNA binding protein
MTDAPEYLRAGDIARLSGASVRTVRRWIADEILPSVKVRGMRLVPRKAVERLFLPARWTGQNRKSKLKDNNALVTIGKTLG